MLQRDPQTLRLYLHDAITEKELDIHGTEHLKTHRGSDTTNSELYTADILRNALNVKSRQLSTGRSIEEMTGKCEAEAQQGCTERLVSVRDAIRRSGPEREKSHRPLHGLRRDASNPERRRWQIVPVRPAGCAKKKVISAASFSAARRSEVFAPKPSENSIPTSGGNVNTNHAAARKAAQLATIERSNPFDPELGAHTWIRSAEDADTWRGVDAGRPTHIKRACGIASQTLHLYMYDAILRRRLTSRRRCRSDRPCCRCSGPDSRRWYSAPPPWARPRPRSRSGASPWCHRRT